MTPIFGYIVSYVTEVYTCTCTCTCTVLCTWDFDPGTIKYIRGTKRVPRTRFSLMISNFHEGKTDIFNEKHGFFYHPKIPFDMDILVESKVFWIFNFLPFLPSNWFSADKNPEKNVYFCTSKSDFISYLMYLYFVHWNSIKIRGVIHWTGWTGWTGWKWWYYVIWTGWSEISCVSGSNLKNFVNFVKFC